MEKIISIVTATYNAEATIEKTLKSVKNNKNDFVEFIIIDGLSKDNTIEICNRYDSIIDKKIIEKDKGIYDAENKGVRNATGKYVYFLQAGDILENGIIHEIIEIIRANEYPDFVYGNVVWGGEGRIYNGRFSKVDLCRHNICQQAIFYKKSKIIEYGYFNIKFNVLADYDMNISFFGDNNNSIVYTEKIISIYDEGYSGKNKDAYYGVLTRIKRFYEKLGMKYCLIYIAIATYRKIKSELINI